MEATNGGLTVRGGRILALASAFGLATAPAHAQGLVDGFFQPQGGGSVSVAFTSESFDRFYFGPDRVPLPPEFREIEKDTVSLFLTYGLADGLGLVVNLPYISSSADGDASLGDLPPQTASDLQDAAVFLKWRPLRRRAGNGALSVALAGGASTPLASYVENALLSNGNGATGLDGRALVQYSFDSGLFASAQAGYGIRSADVPDSVSFGGKIGYAHRRFYVDAWVERQVSQSGPDIGDPGFTFPATRVESSRVGLTVYYPAFQRVGVAFGYGAYIDGRNLPDTSYLSLALDFSFGG